VRLYREEFLKLLSLKLFSLSVRLLHWHCNRFSLVAPNVHQVLRAYSCPAHREIAPRDRNAKSIAKRPGRMINLGVSPKLKRSMLEQQQF